MFLNTLEVEILKEQSKTPQKKNKLKKGRRRRTTIIKVSFVGGFLRWLESLVFVGWSVGIQLTCWIIPQTWR